MTVEEASECLSETQDEDKHDRITACLCMMLRSEYGKVLLCTKQDKAICAS